MTQNANDGVQVQLNDDLLELELQQMEQDEQIISGFEQSYNQLVAAFIDTVQSDFCAKLRDIENDFFNKALQVMITSTRPSSSQRPAYPHLPTCFDWVRPIAPHHAEGSRTAA